MVNRIAVVLCLALGTATLSAVLASGPAHAQEAKKETQRVGAKVAKPLKAAQAAMQKEDWDTALAKILEADALADKTAFEDYQIAEFLSYVYLKKADYANAAVTYDRIIKSGLVAPADLTDRTKVATQLNFQIKNYPKAIEYGQRWAEASGGVISEPDSLLAQAYFIQDDYANALTHAKSAVEISRRNGEPLKEAWLQIMLACYNNSDDMAGVATALESLVREFPNHRYWEQLLGVNQRVEEQDDRVALTLYELMFELDALRRDVDYVEMAQLAIQIGVPGEAVKVLERGFETKVLEEEDVPRRKALLAESRASAQNDQKSLAALETEAKAAKAGQADVALGSAFLSYAQYDKAVETLRRGIAKGGVKRPDEAQIALGRALLQVNQPEEALRAFAAVPDGSKFARVANLWEIYATGPRPIPR